MRRSFFPHLSAALCSASIILLSGGCGTSRPAATKVELVERQNALRTRQGELFNSAIEKLTARLEAQVAANKAAGSSAPPELNLLAISGGGDWGAFGAGFLVGWGSVTDPEFKRPQFDAVSGVSTGALIAPFAFVGTPEALERVEYLYRHPSSNWVELRDWFVWLPWRSSFMDTSGLQHALKDAVNDKLIAQIADLSRGGGLLLVGTTDLDNGTMIAWDVGRQCEQSIQTHENSDRVIQLLSASSAIPVAFPSVFLDKGLYADGGVTSNLLVRAEYASPNSLIRRWVAAHPNGPFPAIRYWVLINNQIIAPPQQVQPKWSAVATAALSASIRAATYLQARLVAAQLDYINARGWGHCEMHVVSIPGDWQPPEKGDFNPAVMNNLADLGRKMGADPKSWELFTMPLSQR